MVDRYPNSTSREASLLIPNRARFYPLCTPRKTIGE